MCNCDSPEISKSSFQGTSSNSSVDRDQEGVANANEAGNNASAELEHAESQRFDGRQNPMWKEFKMLDPAATIDGKESALCKHFKKATFVSNSHYGTTNIGKHLQKCMQGMKTETEDRIYDQKVYRELVARAIIKYGYTFSWVEHEGNREIHAYLNNQCKSICRNTAKADCLEMHKNLKVQLKDTLHKISGRISLTCNLWTSCQTEGYLCLTSHYVDANWKLNSIILNFCHIDTPHNGKTMYNVVLALLQDWGIDDKIFTITLDNASSNEKMQDYLKATLKRRGALLCVGDFFHVRCAAHALNLIVKDGLKVIDHIVVKIRDCVKYIRWSETRKKTFRSCVDLAKIKEVKALWLDDPTRWNSTFMMLDRAILYRKSFVEMSELHCCPIPEEWEMLEQIRDVLDPFNEITELFSGGDYPTSNLYFGIVWKILMLLNELNRSDDELLKAMSVEMKHKFDKYWFNSEEDNYGMLFAFAMILDPRCKLPVLRFCYESLYGNVEAALRITNIQLKLERFYKDYDMSPTPTPTPSININTSMSLGNHKRKYDYFTEFDDQEVATTSIGKSNLEIYLEDAKIERTAKLDILQYWKENEHRYGKLSHLARDILSVPLTTVASESTFSIGGRILNKWKSSYLPENVEALITTRNWLFGYESNEDDEFVGCYVDWATTKSR